MKFESKLTRLFFISLAAISIFLIGCGKGPDSLNSEKDDSNFKRGQKFYRDGRYDDAMIAFSKVIAERKEAPESHLELGRIYQERFQDPITAIYHFKKFLEYKPNAEQSRIVRQMIETAKKDFARTLPGRSQTDDMSRVDLMHILKQVREENLKLKKQVAWLRKSASRKRVVKATTEDDDEPLTFAPMAEEKNQGVTGLYTVVAGDTLSKISFKVYGSSIYWKNIYDANRHVLKSPHDLKIGLSLRVPPRN